MEEIVTFSLSSTFPSNLSPQQDRSLVKTCPNLCRDSLLKRREKVPFKKGKKIEIKPRERPRTDSFSSSARIGQKIRLDFIPGDHTRKRRFVKVNMDEQPLAPSGTGRIYARCLSLKLKSTHNDIRAWSRRGLPGLIKLEPPRRILNLLSYVYHQFDRFPRRERRISSKNLCHTDATRYQSVLRTVSTAVHVCVNQTPLPAWKKREVVKILDC